MNKYAKTITMGGTVGANSGVRPKIKNKYVNKLTSNNPTSNTAITLIALIITIIVLLILAGITLNMVIGENGIFRKASVAKNKTEIAQYEEELRMCVLEMQTDSAEKGKTLTLKDIQENFQTEVARIQNTTEISVNPNDEESITKVTGIYKSYNFEINDKLQARILEQATGTTIGLEIKNEIPKSGYTNKAEDILITIKNPNGIKKITTEDGNVLEPQNNQKSYSIDYTGVDTNRTYTYTVEDSNGKTETKTISVTNIDKLAPKDFEITAENTDEGLKINAEAEDAEATDTDACSGIARYEYYVRSSTEEKYTKYDTSEIKLSKGIYNVYTIAYDKAENKKQSKILENQKVNKVYNNVDAAKIKSDPVTYYGTAVKNFESDNGQTDWKVFYSNGTNIFLIAGDYVEVDKVDISKSKMTQGGKYQVYWKNVPEMQKMNHNDLFNIENRFKVEESSYENAKVISTLLNTDNWTEFLDNRNGTGKALYAIGAPTIEMWMKSWNEKFSGEGNQQLLCNNTKEYGYYVGKGIANDTYINMCNIKEYENSSLYYPHKSQVKDGDSWVTRYWIASPAYSYELIFQVTHDGYVYGYSKDMLHTGLRPVVCLNVGTKLNLMEIE